MIDQWLLWLVWTRPRYLATIVLMMTLCASAGMLANVFFERWVGIAISFLWGVGTTTWLKRLRAHALAEQRRIDFTTIKFMTSGLIKRDVQ